METPPKKILTEKLDDINFRLDKMDAQINVMMNDMSLNFAKLTQRQDEVDPVGQLVIEASHLEDRLDRLERKLHTFWSNINKDFNNLLEQGRVADRQKRAVQATVDRTSEALRDD